MLKDELNYLYTLKQFDFKTKPKLDPIKQALSKLGDFHKKLRVIHITGTNGKGSVGAMLMEILKKAGFKTGLYTSPHLVRYNERMQVNGAEIKDEEVLRLIDKVKSLNVHLSFFEFTTTMALLYFYEQQVDYLILEVGLGGRFDATNVCDAEIAVFTDISLEHTQVLGESIKEIASEKCGIIKENSKVVTNRENAALEFIKEKAGEKLILTDKYNGEVGLKGEFQKRNAGIAYSTAKELGINEEIIKEGIKNVKWQGRLEYINGNILVDCAHNPAAISEITNFVKDLKYNRLIIIFGVMERKEYKKMIKLLPKPDFLILTKPRIDKALDPAKLTYDGKCAVIEDPATALKFAKNIAKEGDLILITGSIYLVGQVKECNQ